MRALYAFSGDPITNGHIDIVRRAAATYETLTVAIGDNPSKENHYLFSADERLKLATHALSFLPNVRCVRFTGLLAEYAYRNGIDVIVRGVRNASDLDDEMSLFSVNQSLQPTVDTIFLPGRPELAHISSGVVKAVVSEGGDVSAYCPLRVKEALERRILQRYQVGVAGGIAAGKTTIARNLVKLLQHREVAATHVSLDAVGHYVLGDSKERVFRETRKQIAAAFGDHVANSDGTINRQTLGRIVFADRMALQQLNGLMNGPMLSRLYEETRRIQGGIVLIEGAILVEANWGRLVNNNIILVDAPDSVRCTRVEARGVSHEEAQSKLDRQLPHAQRLAQTQERISADHWGKIWQIDTAQKPDLSAIANELCQSARLPAVQEA